VSSRVAPTRSLESAASNTATGTCCAQSRPKWRWLPACRWCSPSRIAGFGPPGVDRAAHQHLTSTFAADGWRVWDNLLVRGPLRADQLQPALLPARAFVGYLTVASPRSSRGRRCSPRRLAAVGRRRGSRRSCSPRSGPACSWPASTRSRSAARSRSRRSSPCSAIAPCCSSSAASHRCLRARSRSCCSPSPSSGSRGRSDAASCCAARG